MNQASQNKFQSEQLRAVREHLTDSEKKALSRLMTRFGVWMLFLASIGSTTAALHGTFGIVLIAVWAVLFFGSFIFMMSSLSKFYCSTDWGRQHGYSPKTFRFFELPQIRK
jgi:hypothetical protein